MYRKMLLAVGLLTSTAGVAQSVGDLSIGYVKGSMKGDSIYLNNPDGTAETKVYQAQRTGRFGAQIDRVSLRPGGGEVAFILNSSQLWVQRHDANGPIGDPVQVVGPSECSLYSPDYRSDGDLYVAASCAQPSVLVVDTDSASVTSSFSTGDIAAMAAVGTSLLYVEAGAVVETGELKLRTADGTTTTIVTPLSYTLPLYVDAVGNDGVLSGPSSFRTVDLTTGDLNSGCTSGGMVKLSPSGTQMVYEFRNMLFVHNSDCSGAPSRIARGTKYVAWRSN